jgi:hypothetical protein
MFIRTYKQMCVYELGLRALVELGEQVKLSFTQAGLCCTSHVCVS